MENNGRGIFYGVIGVATLVVAIIGATFAYFSAAAGSENNITAGGAQISLGWAEDVTGLKSKLIPVETGFKDIAQTTLDEAAAATAFASSSSVGKTACSDVNGNNICSVYEFTISNPSSSTAAQRVYASLTPASNDMENLKFAIFKGTSAEVDASTTGFAVNGAGESTTTANAGELVVPATALAKGSTATITLGNLEEVIAIGGSTTYTVILWIEEIGETQAQGGSFAGKINFTTENGGQGVTGVLAA